MGWRYHALPLLAALSISAGCDIAATHRSRPAEVPPRPVVEGTLRMDELLGRTVEPVVGDLRPYIVEARASTVSGRRLVPEFAFDGDPQTRWSSEWKDDQWIEAYFDRPVAVERITIHWEAARAASFAVSLLNAESEWLEMGRARGAQGLVDTLPFARPVRVRGIRIDCGERATEWGHSIFEVAVEGRADGPPPEQSLMGYQVPPDAWELREREIAERLLAEAAADPATSDGLGDDAFLDLVARRAFDYFWWESHPETGLTKDRARNYASSEEVKAASVAAVGFALTAYAVGVERGWVERPEALERVRVTLRTFDQGLVRNARGFFPHFVNMFTGKDIAGTEISTIDTALFLAGAIVAMEYFDDAEVGAMVTRLMDQVDWSWACHNDPHFVSHGLDSSGNFLAAHWGSMTEGLLIYLLALGSETHGLPAASWDAIDRTFGEEGGYRFLIEHAAQTMFPFHYPALWYDFRARIDRSGVDYFQNATRAALAMRDYCLREAQHFPRSYGPDLWGVSPCDGPDNQYKIYGFPPGQPYSATDGTVAIHAIGGAMPFIPGHALRALRRIYDAHHETWGKYGFTDALNPTQAFVTRDAIGLDTGTVLLGIENHRSGLVWDLFMKSRWIRRAGWAIGWTRRPGPADPDGPVDLARRGTWKITTGGGEFASPHLDDTTWQDAVVPDRWENLGPPFAGYDGAAWYRVTFGLDGDRLQRWRTTGRPIRLVLGGVDDYDQAYVNGFRVGATRAEQESFRVRRSYEVPARALTPGRNVVAVQVMDAGGRGGIWLGPVELGP